MSSFQQQAKFEKKQETGTQTQWDMTTEAAI